ncbi:ankyrin repeat domain-containing protein 54-like [Lineus longissimus]|uniref:ankyrin repeat domain-containing protein 54-like n=1 Tax=Lineus longissimus TaxID=88925 RepID=UPI002B4C9BAE
MEARLVEVASRGDIATVKKLLRKNIDPNFRDESGFTAVARASAGGHAEVVRLLLEAKGDPNTFNAVLTRPLHLAAAANHTETVKHLILGGADMKTKTRDGYQPADLVSHDKESWQILHNAKLGDLPEIEDINELPFVPDYSIPGAKPKKEKGKKGKKGKKKGGKKKGGKKKGKGKGKKKKKK